MKSKVHVVSQGGKWRLASSSGLQRLTGTYNTKAEAISAAQDASQAGKVIIHTSTGQVIRNPTVKTSRDAKLMRQAVLNAVQRSAKQR